MAINAITNLTDFLLKKLNTIVLADTYNPYPVLISSCTQNTGVEMRIAIAYKIIQAKLNWLSIPESQ